MNTKITYLYRDADNYKKWNECVIDGVLTDEQQAAIFKCLDMGEYFIPGAVGLPEERFGAFTDADHCWFELWVDAFSETDQKCTVKITPDELVAAFQSCKDNWPDNTKLEVL